METNQLKKSSLLSAVSFFGSVRVPIKSLAGFDKRTRLPDSLDGRQTVLGKMATEDVEKDLDLVFDRLKSKFGYKRRELKVTGPVDGSGCIETPAFEYRIDLIVDLEDEQHIYWRRSIGRISQPDTVFSDEFANCFDKSIGQLVVELQAELDIESIIDHVEDSEESGFEIEYNREATWCEIESQDSDSKLRIEGDQITVSPRDSSSIGSPADLFHCYWEMQQLFLETIELPG